MKLIKVWPTSGYFKVECHVCHGLGTLVARMSTVNHHHIEAFLCEDCLTKIPNSKPVRLAQRPR